ncbi:MAG: GNAT family N-acetyltransferase [bacterium]
MKEIIPPVERELLEAELTGDKFIRTTNNGGNELYIITHHDSPNVIKEIGRIREITFREAGGGTGKEADIDQYDVADTPYRQLIVWDPKEKEILGGYRFFYGKDGVSNLATGNIFHFSEEFIKDYLPYIIELGRSFVQPQYQSTAKNKKALYALDNLWDGLGAIVVDNPHIKYMFGKVTMYKKYNVEARNHILYFMEKHFGDNKGLVKPKKPLETNIDRDKMKKIFTGKNFMADYKILSQKVRALGENIPPLINAYMNLSPTMKTFGSLINESFGGVEETAIMVTIKDIYPSKTERHISSYISIKEG